MENALVPYSYKHNGRCFVGLNPCFNGKCTRTNVVADEEQARKLS